MKKVFVSGCYDIIHAGHIQFFSEARALGDHLTVSFASDQILWNHKERRSSLPQEHKQALLLNLTTVDAVVIGENETIGLDFQDQFRQIRPDILAVTEDDQHETIKRALCKEVGAEYFVLPKTPPNFTPVSTSGIVKWIQAPDHSPVRVDFGGGWLDVPKFARKGAFVVNCAISPTVSLKDWQYEKSAGLGGSGAWALLNGKSGISSELKLGVGWQDPAVISETGLCVWKSGPKPMLSLKRDGKMLQGKMALLYTGSDHDTPATVNLERDFDKIEKAGAQAAQAVNENNLELLGEAIRTSYSTQTEEGMEPLPEEPSALACKYCGGGYGGYALYLFKTTEARDAFVNQEDKAMVIEPYLKPLN